MIALCAGVGATAFAALQLALPVFGSAFRARGIAPPDARASIASGLSYLIVAAAFFVTGVGALRDRAWARPALVSLAWIWLLTGVLVVLVLALFVPVLPVPGELVLAVRAIILVGGLGLGIVLPVGLLWLLRVPAGLEVSRPSHWPPQPVLVLAVALAATSVLSLPTLVRPVIPLFHVVLTGMPAAAATLGLAALSAWLAREVYRLEHRGLVGTALLFAFFGVSLVVTALAVDPMALWTALGAGADDADALSTLPVGRAAAASAAALAAAASLVWLASLRRYFSARGRT